MNIVNIRPLYFNNVNHRQNQAPSFCAKPPISRERKEALIAWGQLVKQVHDVSPFMKNCRCYKKQEKLLFKKQNKKQIPLGIMIGEIVIK